MKMSRLLIIIIFIIIISEAPIQSESRDPEYRYPVLGVTFYKGKIQIMSGFECILADLGNILDGNNQHNLATRM